MSFEKSDSENVLRCEQQLRELNLKFHNLGGAMDRLADAFEKFVSLVLSQHEGSQEVDEVRPSQVIEEHPDGECPQCESTDIGAMSRNRRCRECDFQWEVPA